MASKTELLELLGGGEENPVNLDRLIGQLQKPAGVTPFVGAGMSIPFGFPAWTDFLLEVAKIFAVRPRIKELVAKGKYEEAAEVLQKKAEKHAFQRHFEAAFGDARIGDAPLSGAIRWLPQLSSGPVLTTNFDHLLERVYRQEGSPFAHQVWGTNVDLAVKAFRRELRLLLKIHGDVDDTGNRVLTLTEYKAQYGSTDPEKIDRTRPLPRLLDHVATMRPFLFLGCSLSEDRTVSILLSVARETLAAEHFAIVEAPAQAKARAKRSRDLAAQGVTAIFFRHGKFGLIETILEFLAAQIPEEFRSKRGVPPTAALPADRTTFIGRAQEVAAVRQKIAAHALVTLSGPGGCGKTRLALEAARQSAARFPDGVWLAELASVKDEALVPQAVAGALGLKEQRERPPTAILSEYLSTRKALLIMDNCEHLSAACATLAAEIISKGKDIRILATSRALLNLSGEQIHKVGSLKGPPAGGKITAAKIAGLDAVRLFTERAGLGGSAFLLTDENAASVAQICRRLDGIALAIELAAARLRTFSVEWIAARLDDSLGMLTQGSRDAPLRQKTLLATIDWSFQLLAPEEQRLLRRLSVFRGGWTLAAAGEVCAWENADEMAVADALEKLADQSLVQIKPVPSNLQLHGCRYDVLETVRQFGAAKLEEAGETRTVAERHRAWCVRFAEERAPVLREGGDQSRVLDELEAEHDNVRGAMDWCPLTADRASSLRMGAALWRFWETRGYLSEGRQELGQILDAPETPETAAALGGACSGAGLLAYRQGDTQNAHALFQRALEIEQRRGDPKCIANCQNDLGLAAQAAADLPTALRHYREFLKLARGIPAEREIAIALFNCGNTELNLGNLPAAAAPLEESQRLFVKLKQESNVFYPMVALGWLAFFQNDIETAGRVFTASFEGRKNLKLKGGMADSANGLCRVALARGDRTAARAHFSEGLTLALEVGAEKAVAQLLESAAILLQQEGTMAAALTLSSAAARLRQKIQSPRTPVFEPAQAACEALTLAALSAADAQRATDSGMTIKLDDVMALAGAPPSSAAS